jgi:phosphoglycolate phosphatase
MTADRVVLTPPRAVLFDWDNTLVDNWATIAGAFNTTLLAMGHRPWTIEETRARVRASLRDSFPKLFGERWEEAKRIYVEDFAKRHLQTLKALPDAEALLRELSARSLWTGVVSNKTGTFLRKEVEHLGWAKYFRSVVGAGDAAKDKPAPDPVYLALAESGIVAGPEVWFVGDTEMDMACAWAAGCVPVLLSVEEADPLVYAGRVPVWQGRGCADLTRLIQNLGDRARSPTVS